MRTRLFFTIGILFFTLHVAAQHRLLGRVIDAATQKPVGDVEVSVYEKDMHTKTNVLGYFEVFVDTSDFIVLEKSFYETGVVKVSGNNALTILFKKRTETAYRGGLKELFHFYANHINYPLKARRNMTQGIVYASFDIDSTGQMQNIKILSDIGDGCGDEIIRLLNEVPNHWETTDTTTTFIQPVVFRIGNSDFSVDESKFVKGKLLDPFVITARGIK